MPAVDGECAGAGEGQMPPPPSQLAAAGKILRSFFFEYTQ